MGGWAGRLVDRRWSSLLIVLAVALALGVPAPQSAAIFIDSVTFLDLATDKPPLPWLFFSLFGTGFAAVWAQTILSLSAWTWCGWTLGAGVGAALGAALALAAPVALWNGAVLSESLALSGCAVAIGATALLAEAWTRARFALWTAAILAFTAARVSDFILVPFLAVPMLLLEPRAGRKAAVAAVLIVAVAAGWWWSNSAGERERTRIRMTNIVLARVLTDPAMQAHFVARGMPVEPALEEFRGRPELALPLARGPEFQRETPRLQAWLMDGGRTAYAAWLLRGAPHDVVVSALAANTAATVVVPVLPYGAGVRQRAAASMLATPFALAGPPPWLWLLLVGLALGAAAARRRLTPAAALAASLALGTYALAFIGYHADAIEVDRHLLPARVLYRVVPWVAVAALFSARRSLRLDDARRD